MASQTNDGEFRRRERAGFFFDTVAMFGLPYHYGLPRFDVSDEGPIDAVMLRASLVPQFRCATGSSSTTPP